MAEDNQQSAAATTQADQGTTEANAQAQTTDGTAQAQAAVDTNNGSQANTKVADTQVPEKYELKLPDGAVLNPKRLDGIAQYAKEHALTSEQAQALVERENSILLEVANEQDQLFKTQVDNWKKEIEQDRELGGERFKENAETAARALREIFGPEIADILDETGYGNNPVLFKGAVKLGRLMANDKFVRSGAHGSEPKSLEERLYPKKD
jgi:hypothetical protein